MFQRNAWLALGLVGLALMGCSKETTSSSNIKTGGIAALIDVDDLGGTKGATVKVELRVGGSSSNTYVSLDNGDKLIATAGDVTKEMTAAETGIYTAPFGVVEAGTEFTVTLDRPNDTTAKNNSGTLPDPFEVDVPPTDDKSRKDDDLEVTWAPATTGDKMALEFDGDCIFPTTASAAATATSYVAKAGSISSTGGDKPEACQVSVSLSRTRSGEADSAFDPESYFRLHEIRTTSFSSNP